MQVSVEHGVAAVRMLLLSAPLLLAVTVQAEETRVDLNRPGVMEQIQRDNPKRFHAIENILKVSSDLPCRMQELKVLELRYGVDDLDCGVLLFTSYPTQRGVHFRLDGIEYSATVKMDADAKPEPAVDSGDKSHADGDVNYR